jgi:hypothetical protein
MIKKLTLDDIQKEILKRKRFREKYGKWILIFSSILFLILAGVFIPKFITVLHNVCYVKEYQERYSPDGKHKILVYTNICTSKIFTEISILPRNSVLPHNHGNIFSALGNPILFDINTRWEDSQHIVIETNGKATPDYMENHLGDIGVEYVVRQIIPTQKTPFYFTTSTRTFTPTPIPTLNSTPTPFGTLSPTHLPSSTPTISPSP